jgi:chlorophyllide a reductase subunit Y
VTVNSVRPWNAFTVDTMRDFFEGVGTGDTAGIWEDTPVVNTTFRKKFEAKVKASANAVDSGEAVGC